MEGLISQEDLREEWNIEEGQPFYPPQHVSYIVKMFMWEHADPKAVARVFMYFLFDLSFFPQNPSTSHNRYADKFIFTQTFLNVSLMYEQNIVVVFDSVLKSKGKSVGISKQ